MTVAVERLLTKHLDTWTAAVEPKSAAGRGSSKKLNLVGIKKLRELILELAVRGQLVPQDESDEPAEVLLARIAAERERLVKEKKIKKQKLLPAVTDDEVSVELPKGWQWTRLGNIAEIGPRNVLSDDTEVSFVPMPLISTSYDGRHGQEVRAWSEIKKAYTHFADGDIGLAKITPCFENSKAAVFSGLKNGYGAGTTELHIARPLGSFYDSLYILLYLKAPQFLVVGQTKMTGSAGQKRVPRDFFVSNPLPFPPLPEQHRIVAKVDELMALCDALEQEQESSIAAHGLLVENLLAALTNAANQGEFKQAWARVAAHFDTLFTTEQSVEQLKQTILQLAVMGKLVEQDPADEPAGVLLERIAAEKARLVKEKKIKKQKVLPEISEEEKVFELPVGWAWCRLTDIGELARGKSKHRPRNDPALYLDGTIPLIQTGDVARSGETIETYSALYNDVGLQQSKLWPKGTMCITIAANIADTGILGFDACFPDSVVGFTPLDPKVSVKYFDFFIRTAKSNLEKFAPSTAQKNINLEILSQVLVPCPPAEEMNRIVNYVDEIFLLCDQLKSMIFNSQAAQLRVASTLTEQVVS